MDYEKAYNEAIERAKQFMSEHPTRAEADLMVALFPELQESEDKRMRKHIIDIIKDNAKSKCIPCDAEIAYLEKQKELPFVKDVILGYPGLYFYDGERMHFQGNPAMEENPYDFAMNQQEKQKEQKPAEWSEKDENALKYIHELISFGYSEKFMDEQTAYDMRVWVNKSLRSCPKSTDNWKPSEEQMEALEYVIRDYREDSCNATANYLQEILDHLKNM